jgi:DNA-binding response OmpR family regulator
MPKILLIEPDGILAGNIRDYFAKAGHQVVVHNDLQQAIIAADKIKPAAVIMEMQLAGRNGIEFLYEFRSYPDWQDLPVIIYTFVKPEELAAYDRVLHDLSVSSRLFKPESNLHELLQSVEGQLVSAAA